MAKFVNLMDVIYPVGSIYITTNATSPADSIGGTWEQIENCLLAASGDTYNLAGRFDGNNTIKTVEIPDHQHRVAAWNSSSSTYSECGFWRTNAAGGALWPLLSFGSGDNGTGWNLWTNTTWRVDDNGQLVTKPREHIPYHYSLNVYKRTA